MHPHRWQARLPVICHSSLSDRRALCSPGMDIHQHRRPGAGSTLSITAARPDRSAPINPGAQAAATAFHTQHRGRRGSHGPASRLHLGALDEPHSRNRPANWCGGVRTPAPARGRRAPRSEVNRGGPGRHVDSRTGAPVSDFQPRQLPLLQGSTQRLKLNIFLAVPAFGGCGHQRAEEKPPLAPPPGLPGSNQQGPTDRHVPPSPSATIPATGPSAGNQESGALTRCAPTPPNRQQP